MHPIAKRWRSSPTSHFLPKSGRLRVFCSFCQLFHNKILHPHPLLVKHSHKTGLILWVDLCSDICHSLFLWVDNAYSNSLYFQRSSAYGSLCISRLCHIPEHLYKKVIPDQIQDFNSSLELASLEFIDREKHSWGHLQTVEKTPEYFC